MVTKFCGTIIHTTHNRNYSCLLEFGKSRVQNRHFRLCYHPNQLHFQPNLRSVSTRATVTSTGTGIAKKAIPSSSTSSCGCDNKKNNYIASTDLFAVHPLPHYQYNHHPHQRAVVQQQLRYFASSSSDSPPPSMTSSDATSSLLDMTIDHTPDKLRQQMSNVISEYIYETSNESKRAKKNEIKSRMLERLESEAGQRLVDNFNNYVIYDTAEEANQWAKEMISTLQQHQRSDSSKPVYVGIHVGWNCYGKRREKSVTHLFSISFPNQPVICLHLYKMDCYKNEKKFPHLVRELLQLPFISACGIHVNRFLSRIKRYLHIIVPIRIEIDKLAMIMNPRSMKEEIRLETGYLDFFEDPKNKRLPSIRVLCARFLNIELDGTIGLPHNVDYFRDPLPERFIKIATLEAYHYRILCETMTDMVRNDITMPQPSVKFQVGTKVKVFIGSRIDHAAEGIIEYLGGVNGENVAFGEKMINRGYALVRIVEVLKWDAKPKYSKETFMLYGLQWERDLTMSTVFSSELPIIPVDTKRLVRMDEIDTNLFKEKVKKKKKMSKARIKKMKRRKAAKNLVKQEKADMEAKLSNYWFV